MSWPEGFGEPLASAAEEAARYVQAELEREVPEGWVVRCVDGDRLAWVIAKKDQSITEYGVRLSKGLDFLLFTYGNTDVGAFTLHQALARSLVIDAASLRHFRIGACLQHLMSHYEPNQWGFS